MEIRLEELPVEYDGTEDFSKSKLVDPDLADYEYLDWLAQFNGTSVRKNIYAPNPANATKTQNLGVRVATTTAGSTLYSLATSFANGDTVDGVVLKTGDRILIKNQAFLSQNGIYVVGNAGRLSTASTTFTASGTSISGAATYTGVSQSATSGSGTGAVFTITKTGSGTTYTGFITVTITSGGANYVVGDTITVPGASLGGGGDLTLTIGGSLTGAPTRATDMPAGLLNISAGFSVWVNSGTLYSGTIWRLRNATNPTVGTTQLSFGIKQISVDVATTTAGTLATSLKTPTTLIISNYLQVIKFLLKIKRLHHKMVFMLLLLVALLLELQHYPPLMSWVVRSLHLEAFLLPLIIPELRQQPTQQQRPMGLVVVI